MSIVDAVHRLLSRGEVDDLERGTTRLEAHRAQERDEAERLAALHRRITEDRDPGLHAAVTRRNAAR